MTVDQRNLLACLTNSTDMQTWVTGLHNQLVAVGLTQTADTGQINPATVSLPGGSGTTAGYEIWRFNDTLQATAPVFFKIEYGLDGGTLTQNPGLWLTAGTGSNGAGTLTGNVSQRQALSPSGSKTSGVTLPSYCCYEGGGLGLFTNYDTSGSFSMNVVLDRTRDGSGNSTGDGLIVWFGSNAGGTTFSRFQVIPLIGTTFGAGSSGSPCVGVGGWITGTFPPVAAVIGGNVPLVPMTVLCGKFLYGKMMHSVPAAQVTGGATISASIFGGTHTLMALPAQNITTGPFGNDAVVMLWE